MSKASDKRFEKIVEPRLNALYRTAFRLTGFRADAEDLVQDVCLRAYPRLAELEQLDNPLAWLLRVQYRLFIDHVRRRERSPFERLDPDIESSSLMASRDPGPEEQASAAAAGQRLHRAWQRLEKDQRALLALHAEGYSLSELQHITGLPKSALKARLYRARARLAKLLKTKAVSSSQASGVVG